MGKPDAYTLVEREGYGTVLRRTNRTTSYHARFGSHYLGAYDSIGDAEAAIADHLRHKDTLSRVRPPMVERALARLMELPVEVRRPLLNDPDDPIAEFFASRGITLSLREMGDLYGRSREYMRQVQEVALEKLRYVGGEDLRDAYAERCARRPTYWQDLEVMADA